LFLTLRATAAHQPRRPFLCGCSQHTGNTLATTVRHHVEPAVVSPTGFSILLRRARHIRRACFAFGSAASVKRPQAAYYIDTVSAIVGNVAFDTI
jgi:hypothetical protein